MADPLSITSGILPLTVFAFQASRVLYQTVASLQNDQRSVRQFKEELKALGGTLETLQETVSNTNIDLSILRIPLLRCGKACEDFKTLIIEHTTHSDESKTSFCDWAKLKYLGNDIVGLKNILAGYKSTIMIALGDANMRTSAVTTSALKEYKDLVTNATVDLEEHLREINDRLQSFAPQGPTLSIESTVKQQEIQEEKDSIKQCLAICAQASMQADKDRINIFEDISTADDDHVVIVSTIGDLISARRVTAGARSQQWLRQIPDATLQQLSHNLGHMAAEEPVEQQSEASDHLEGRYGTNRGLGWRPRQVGGHISDLSLQQVLREMSSIHLEHGNNRGSPSSRGITISVQDDVKATDKDGRTPLHDAARAGSNETVLYLLDRGADVKATDKDGRTPLHDAAQAGSQDVTLQLLDRSSDVKATDKDGRTPLHNAARAGSEDTVLYLLEKGADIQVTDKDGRTPLDNAVSTNLASLICLLVPLGVSSCNIDNNELLVLRQSFSTLSLPNSNAALFLPLPDSVVHYSSLYWGGFKTYEECNKAIGDILTISRTKEGHSYTARPVSEYLAEIHPDCGLDLLDWITRICGAYFQARSEKTEARIRPQSSYLRVRPNHQSNKSNETPLTLPTSNQHEVVVTGLLNAQKLTLILSSESEAAMSEVISALTWMLAVLQPRPENVEGLFYLSLSEDFLDSGIPQPIKLIPEKPDRYCWMELFTYCVVVGNLPVAEVVIDIATEGLEIDFDLLVELAAVDRQATVEDGVTMLYGFDTAIVPLAPAEARRWHFMTTEGRQITPRRAEHELIKRKLDTVSLGGQYLFGKVYVGWCPAPVVGICSPAFMSLASEVIKPSGVPAVKHLEEQPERSSAKDVSFVPRFGFLGSSLGLSAGVKREKKYRRVVVITKRTQGNNFEGVLASAMRTPSIFWDSRYERAWLLPVISVLAFASLHFIESQKYSFRRERNGKSEKTGIDHCDDMKTKKTNTTEDAAFLLRRNSSLQVDTANGEPVSDPPTFAIIARTIWERMCDGEDLCISDLSGHNLEVGEGICGYDLTEAMHEKRIQLRRLQYLGGMRSWIPLCQGHKIQIIFSQYVGEVLSCECDAANGLTAGQQPAKGSLTCLLDDLRSFYGANWSMLNQNSCSNGLPIGENFEWIPRGCVVGEGQSFCSRRMLQSITEKQPKRWRKKLSPNTIPQGSLMGPSTIQLPEGNRLIRFGSATLTST